MRNVYLDNYFISVGKSISIDNHNKKEGFHVYVLDRRTNDFEFADALFDTIDEAAEAGKKLKLLWQAKTEST